LEPTIRVIARNVAVRFRRKARGMYYSWLGGALRSVPWDTIWPSRAATVSGDRDTIGPDTSPLAAAFHYATLEATVARALHQLGKTEVRGLLDIGSGAGHWIQYFTHTFPGIRSIDSMEISAGRCEFLRKRFADDPRVRVHEGSAETFAFTGPVDLVCMVGVAFHIVDDARLNAFLAAVDSYLDPDGVVVLNDLLPLVSYGNQFVVRDGKLICWKYVRSNARWRAIAARARLRCTVFRNHAWLLAPRPIPEGHLVCLHR
jgi:SAM-dependent methyltransferase